MKWPPQTTWQVSPVKAKAQERVLPIEDEECNESSGSSSKASSPRASESESNSSLEIICEENGRGRRRRSAREVWDKWSLPSNFNLRSNVSNRSSLAECNSQFFLQRNDEECSEVTDDTEQEVQDCLDSVFELDLETPKVRNGSTFPIIPGISDQCIVGNNPPNKNGAKYDMD